MLYLFLPLLILLLILHYNILLDGHQSGNETSLSYHHFLFSFIVDSS